MFTHLLLTIIFEGASSHNVDAFPISNIASPDVTRPSLILPYSNTSLIASQPPLTCDCNQRTGMDILWSCASTLFLATWVGVHPNVPAPNEEFWRIIWRRLQHMYWAIIAPELVLTFAVRQYLGARNILNSLKREGHDWTMTHAHFLQMGGFHVKSDEYTGVLFPTKFFEFYRMKKISFPRITEEEILDKSKADGLMKIIVVIQILWFVVQCMARLAQGYALAPLEVTTLAVTVCTFMLSFIWWDKPLDIQHPIFVELLEQNQCNTRQQEIRVRLLRLKNEQGIVNGSTNGYKNTKTMSSLQLVNDDNSSNEQFGQFKDSHQSSRFLPIRRGIKWTIGRSLVPLKALYSTFRSIINSALIAIDKSIQEEGLLCTIRNITYSWPLLHQTRELLYSRKIHPDGTRVTSYYAYYAFPVGSFWRGLKLVLMVPVPCATALGLVHCILWDSFFPTTAERLLWRICALTLSCLPILVPLGTSTFDRSIMLLTGIEFDFYAIDWTASSPVYIMISIVGCLLNIAAFGGILFARLYLIVEAFLSLRALSPSALEDIDWSGFLPHF